MNNKGEGLSNLDRKEDAIKAFDACIEKFGNETDTTIKQYVAEATDEKGALLSPPTWTAIVNSIDRFFENS